MSRFEGKSVLVTGGSSGIGLAAASAYAREGARVVITGRNGAPLEKVVGQLAGRGLTAISDTSDADAPEQLVEYLKGHGIGPRRRFHQRRHYRVLAVHSYDRGFLGPNIQHQRERRLFATAGHLPLLNPGAAILLNGSINAHIGAPGTSVYAASKAALISLAKTLSAELVHRGVRVNVISQGPVQTLLYAKLGLDQLSIEAANAQIEAKSQSAASASPKKWPPPFFI